MADVEPPPEDRLGLTPEQWECFRRATQGFGEQDERGVDLSLLRENLKLTPTERLRKHDRALRLMRQAIVVKIVTLVVMALPGIWLVQQAGALGGAWTINVLYVVSVALTAAVTLPELKRRAMPRMEIQAGAFN